MKILSLGLYLDTFSIVFQNFDFWPFYGLFLGIFWRFSGFFCPWTSYRSHILTQEYFLNMIFRTVSRNIVWNCHFLPYLGGRRLLRPERSPAARRCACFHYLQTLTINLLSIQNRQHRAHRRRHFKWHYFTWLRKGQMLGYHSECKKCINKF